MAAPRRASVLVVDDEAAVMESVQELLRLDYQVLGVTRPSEAIDILGRQPVDVVEMSLRGFREANVRLLDLNESLKRQNVLLAETARSEREAHEARKRAERQLVQSEKLAALGLLVAGVAHEINNPLAFVLGSMAVLMRDVRLLREACELYRRGDVLLSEHAPELAAEIASSTPASISRIRSPASRTT